MATLVGKLAYDASRTGVNTVTMPGIVNVPMVLQNLATGESLTVLTNYNGYYSFRNVPNGNYQVVEAYGAPGAVPSPGDFTNSTVSPILNGGTVPPLSYVANPPRGATNLDCTTQNTILISVTGPPRLNLNILNGPVKYTPITEIMDHNVTVTTNNLITIANKGDFGSYSPGTSAYTFSNTTYSGIGEGFIFARNVPSDGQYAIENITSPRASGSSWWSFADHTTGNETGRMMVINGDNPGALLFNETITLKPNTYYLFSAWILNMIRALGYQAPQLAVKIIDDKGATIVEKDLGQNIPANIYEPEWVQIGSIFYSGSNTSLTIQFISQGAAAQGNDYALDDISLKEVILPDKLPLYKKIDKDNATIGDSVTYTVTITNTYDFSIKEVFFKDLIPSGLSFIPGSVKINGTPIPTANPNNGFNLSDIANNETVTIDFSALVESVPTENPTINTAEMTYEYTFIQGSIPTINNISSNEVPLLINEIASADLRIVKTTLNENIKLDDIITYLLTITNDGPGDAVNVVITDSIPTTLINAEFSIDGGLTWNGWMGTYRLPLLVKNTSFTLLIRATINISAGTISNTAMVISDTPDPDLDNNKWTIETPVLAMADLSVIKTACPNKVPACGLLTYTIIVTNNGPHDAINVEVYDKLPKQLLKGEYSIDHGKTWYKWNESLHFDSLTKNTNLEVLIRGRVDPHVCGKILNTVTVTSDTPDPNYRNNRYSLITPIRCC